MSRSPENGSGPQRNDLFSTQADAISVAAENWQLGPPGASAPSGSLPDPGRQEQKQKVGIDMNRIYRIV